MYTMEPWYPYVQQLYAYCQVQSERLLALESALERVHKELKQLKEEKRIHIDKIEYKFDQLKVETLEGTLNIGLNPNMVEDLAVSGEGGTQTESQNQTAAAQPASSQTTAPLMQSLRADIMHELMSFMEKQVPTQLTLLQAQSEHTLDSWHQKLIVEDLSKQVDHRVLLYLKQMEPELTMDKISSVKDTVIFRTKSDIQMALKNYFNKLNG